MPASLPITSYCGPPPLPDDLWGRWNLDPLLIAMLAIASMIVVVGRNGSARDRLAFLSAVMVLAVIFISPLCALTVALFSARVVHHVLLVAVAAPLLALWLKGRVDARAADGLSRLLTPLVALHTVIFWLWHVPDAYTMALTSTPVYWAMQISLLGSAVLFWAAVLVASPARAIAALVAVTVQMGLLGALLVFAGQPLYWPHLVTTTAFGLKAHADQQLAGLIMWVPASLPYLLVALVRLAHSLRSAEVGHA